MSKEQEKSDACDWLENLEGDAWADACEEIAASVQKHTEQAEGAQGEREALPYWEPCNPGCDPEFNGERSRYCAQLCHNARAALAQPSRKCATCNDRGHVCLDWEAGAWEECPDCKAQEPKNCPTFMGEPIAQPYEAPRDKINALFKALGFSGTASVGDILDAAIEHLQAQPSPAPELEQVERFEPAHGTDRGGNVFAYMIDNEAGEYMEFAQHDRIIGALRAEIDEVDGLSKRLDDLLHQTAIALRGPEPPLTRYGYADLPLRVKTLVQERDDTQEKLAELEGQSGVEFVYDRDELVAVPRGLLGAACHAIDKKRYAPRTIAKLREYARGLPAPVAQAGQVPEGYMLITQDQVERHATTAWECPQQSRVVLVSTLKRLHEKNSAAPQPAGGE